MFIGYQIPNDYDLGLWCSKKKTVPTKSKNNVAAIAL